METLYLGFNVKGQQLTRTDSYTVYSGSVNFVGAKFIFDWHWNNTNRYAQFVVGENTYTKDIINGVCSVPWECFASAGTFTVTVFGGTLITANAITIKVLQSAIQPDQLPNEPTAGYFDEVVTMVNEAKADTIFAAGGAETDRILAEDAKNEARKWADGTGAIHTDPQYENNAKFYSELIAEQYDDAFRQFEAYSPGKKYTPGYKVSYSGSSYFCIKDSLGNAPTNGEYWILIAAKGDTGAAGADGYTPVKGTDYFTDADKSELVAAVLAEIPVVESEGY